MLRTLETIKKEYREKRIYVWDIDRDAICTFTRAFFGRVNIVGFISPQEEYVGQMFMNRPIVTLDQVACDADGVILVSNEVSEEILRVLPEKKAKYWSELVGFDETLCDQKIIIYGTGYGADQLCKKLDERDIKISLYCVTKRDQQEKYKGKNVIEVSELENYQDCTIIISVISVDFRREILDTLAEFSGIVYADLEYIVSPMLPLISPMQSLDLAMKRNRKIYLYNEKKGLMTQLIEETLNTYGFSVSGYVYEKEHQEQKIECIYEVAYDGVDDKLIIINELFLNRIIAARRIIESAGFSLESLNYTGFLNYTRAKERMLSEWEEYKDPLVGFNILYPQGKPGWKVYGQEQINGIKIIVLGGSTSSEEYCMENWVSKLYYKLKQSGMQIVIYNGAHIDNDIVDEILRLLRDGYVLKPQIVISMSGVNNLHYKKSSNQFNEERLLSWAEALSCGQKFYSGVQSEELPYSFWSRNVQLLKVISNFYGAEFFGFLQPMNITMENKTLWEKSFFERQRHIPGAKDFPQHVNDQSGYINLMALFEHQEGMYFDMCHYTETANEIIANKVYETIFPTLQMLGESEI